MWYGMRKLFSSMFLPLSYLQSAGRKIWGKKVFYWITWSDSQTPEATALVKKKTSPQSIIALLTLSALKRHVCRV